MATINTPVEALQLPILEPTFQLSLAAGLLLSLMSPMGGVPLIDIMLNTDSQGAEVELNALMDLKNQENPLTVEGTIAGLDLSGQVTASPQGTGFSWAGQTGRNEELIEVGFDPATEELLILSQHGQVETDLRLALMGGADLETFEGFRVEGTVGGQPLTMVNQVEITEEGEASMATTGRLGERVIDKQYEGVAMPTGSGITMMLEGTGVNGDVDQYVQTVFTFIP